MSLIRLVVLLFLGLFSWTAVEAQPDTTVKRPNPRVYPLEASPATLRKPSPDTWNDLKENYQYRNEVIPPKNILEELWQRFRNWLFNFLYEKTTQRAREWIQVSIAVVVLGFVLYRFIGMDKIGLFQRKSAGSDVPYGWLNEDIHAIDFNEAIQEAVSQRNFRLAVRLLYLRTLKTLSDQELISWQSNKTNRAYVYELTKPGIRPQFEHLTSVFEYIWYGDFPVDETRYQEIRKEFDTFSV